MEKRVDKTKARAPKERSSRLRRMLFGLALPLVFFGAFAWFCYRGVQRTKLSRPLIEAVQQNDLERVRALLDQGADPGTRDVPNRTETAEDLWKYLLHLDSSDHVAAPVLQIAIFQESDDIARLLISRGAPINAESDYWPPNNFMSRVAAPSTGHTALMDALYVRHTVLARLLLEHGADPNRHPASESTPLMLAIGSPGIGNSGDIAHNKTSPAEMVKLLLERGADARTTLTDGESALRETFGGDLSVVPLLAAKGGDPNTRSYDKWKRTLLIEAAVVEDTGVMKSLIEHGADVNATDTEGRTALMEVCSRMGLYDFSIAGATALLEHHANVNAQDKDGNTALMETAGVGRSNAADFDAVKLLMEHGADPRLKDTHGRTAFEKFSRHGINDDYDLQIAQFLRPLSIGTQK